MMDGYWQRVRNTLQEFCAPSDQLRLHCVVDGAPSEDCQMCGYEGIRWNYILVNDRNGKRLAVGSCCIVNYHVVMNRLGHYPAPIIFREARRKEAEEINRKCPGAAVVSNDDDGLEPWISEPWIPTAMRHEKARIDGGVGPEDDVEDSEEAERELLMDMGLDPDDPDYDELTAYPEDFDEDDPDDD